MLRFALQEDFSFIRAVSTRARAADLEAQIDQGRYRIIEFEAAAVGFLRSYVLWDTLPFIEMIHINASYRNRDLGTQAVRTWESEMAALGHDIGLISTAADDQAQKFWRKLGYSDCGSLVVRRKPTELFMSRDISRQAKDTPPG